MCVSQEKDVTQTRADPVFSFGSNIRKSGLGQISWQPDGQIFQPKKYSDNKNSPKLFFDSGR